MPRGALTIGGQEITPLGFSAVPFLVLIGAGLLTLFFRWEERRERRGESPLLDRSLLRIRPLRAGLVSSTMQQFLLLGTFFVLPVYLQTVLGLDAFETGKRLFPLSVTMVIAALAGPRLAAGFSPRRVVQAGLVVLVAAASLLVGTIEVELDNAPFAVALALFGVGAGLLLSQLGNVIMSSAGEERINEAGGLQGTAQNLGASLGTAVIGSVLIVALTGGFTTKVEQSQTLPPAAQTQLVARAEAGIPIVPVAQVEQAAREEGLPPQQAAEAADHYGDAQLTALRLALGAVALAALLALWGTRGLPGDSSER